MVRHTHTTGLVWPVVTCVQCSTQYPVRFRALLHSLLQKKAVPFLLSPSPLPLSSPPLLSPSPLPLSSPPLLSPSPLPLSSLPLSSLPSPLPLSSLPSPLPLSSLPPVRCKQQVDAYIAAKREDARLSVGGDLRKINHCFKLLKVSLCVCLCLQQQP